MMPEVMCPNCGLTINLENRREVDYGLIMDATKKSATFTELLHATKLSRKTLSIRLKELCTKGAIVKSDGTYKLNGSMQDETLGARSFRLEHYGSGFSRAIRDRRVRTLVWMLMIVTSFSISGYVLAMQFASAPQQVSKGPAIVGYSTMAIKVSNVNDLYGWQVAISFNATELKVLQVTPGDFVGVGYPLFWNSTDREGLLMVGGCLEGAVPGKSGKGTLATFVFEYFISNYKAPSIVSKQNGFDTFLLDSQMANIPVGTKLSLEVVG
jgi:hypothetical protein